MSYVRKYWPDIVRSCSCRHRVARLANESESAGKEVRIDMSASRGRSATWGGRITAVGATVALGALSAVLTTGTANAAVCNGTASGFLAKWGPASKQCSYTSSPTGNGKLRISWSAQSGTSQFGCVEARMSKAANPDPWQGLGCGSSGSGAIAWPANTASMVEVHVKSMNSAVINVDYSY
jgi:hypothetical protein